MNRGSVVRGLAIALALAALAGAPVPARAQFLAPALDRAGFDSRLRQPSLRLAMLGGLSLVVDDENNRLNLWDFGGSGTGLLADRDSTSVDAFADTERRKDSRTIAGVKHEILNAHDLGVGGQAVWRVPGRFAFGLDTGYLTFRGARPVQNAVFEDQGIRVPIAIPSYNGVGLQGRLAWTAHLILGREVLNTRLREVTRKNGATELSKQGETVDYPRAFDITDAKGKVSGYGLGLGWNKARWGSIALQHDWTTVRVDGSNNNARRVYETSEPRKTKEISAVAILTPTPWIRVGILLGRERFHAVEQYRFSLSGGSTGTPLVDRGDRQSRDFKQEYLRARTSIEPERVKGLTLAGDLNVRHDDEGVNPSTGPDNFNDFIATVLVGDTLSLPQALVPGRQELRHWDAGGGGAYRFTEKALGGAEFHRYVNAYDGDLVHARQRITELRAGIEYTLNPTWQARLGGFHRKDDPDVFTSNNEAVLNAVTAGAGYAPPDSRYALDGGLEIARRKTDFPDPSQESGTLLRVMLYSRWRF